MTNLPIDTLIRERMQQLAVTEAELVARIGYCNTAKGLRRLRALMAGDFRRTRLVMDQLPDALEIPRPVVDEAIAASEEAVVAADRARYAASFRPHAIILTERRIPQPIFPVAFAGADRFLRIDLDPSRHRSTYVDQAVAGLAEMAPEGGVPCFGRVTGFVINYDLDRAVQFSPSGRARAILSEPYRIGHASLKVKGRDMPMR